MRNSRRLRHAVLFPLRLLTSFAWRRVTHMLALRGGGADRHPGGHLERCPELAHATPSVTERKGEALELVRTSQPIPVEWNESVAPDVANPAPPAGLPKDFATLSHLVSISAPHVAQRMDMHEVLLRRALAADAPKWAPLSADVISFYARRARICTGPILPVNGLMYIQVALPTAFVRELVN